MKKLSLWYPVKPFFLTQGFGLNGEYYRANGINIAGHNGWDLRAYHGQPVRASHDGEVVYAGIDGKEGYGVVLRTLEPFEYKDGETFFKTIYWHLLSNIPVRVGTRVKVGDIIGYADNTGFSNGDHLHFGLKPQYQGENEWTWFNLEDGNGFFGAIDPQPFFNGFYAEDNQTVISILQQQISLLLKVVEILRLIKK